jgi:hypothetical protein
MPDSAEDREYTIIQINARLFALLSFRPFSTQKNTCCHLLIAFTPFLPLSAAAARVAHRRRAAALRVNAAGDGAAATTARRCSGAPRRYIIQRS